MNRRAVDDMMDGLAPHPRAGRRVLYGGGRMIGCFVQPTLVRARPDMPILKEEIFAPILYMIEFDDLDQAIDWHNDVPQGLSSAIFTTNLISAETFLSHAAATAGSRTSTSGPAARRSAARSAARRTRAAAGNRAATRGRPTCGGRRTRSTGPTHCRSRRASNS